MTILEVMNRTWSPPLEPSSQRCITKARSSTKTGLLILLLSAPIAAQQKLLTLDDIYDPGARVSFSGTPAPEISWIDGSHYAMRRGGRDGVDWVKVDAATATESPLFDAGKMEAALARLPGVSGDEAKRAAHTRDATFNRTYTRLVTHISDDLFAYAFDDGRAVRLTNAPGAEEHASFSPDGRFVAFVRANNLYVSDIATGREIALTSDGNAKLLNGHLDWVYEEEIYGRGKDQAYWWSPDSAAIAFLQLDDTPVTSYPVVDHIPYEQRVEQWDYPKAGDPNPKVKLGIARVTGGAPQWVDTAKYPANDMLIVRVKWAPDSRRVVYAVQNRTQTWLELNAADAATGAPRIILKETSKYWISADDVEPPLWLADGSFLWLSDRSGWRHVYHFKADGTLINQVTSGKWEARTLHGADEPAGWVYFSGTERSPIGGDVYRIKLDGTGLQRLSAAEGTHTAEFSPSFAYYTDAWSNVTTPPQMRLHKGDGTEVGTIAANRVGALNEYRLARPEFLQVSARDGFVMEAMMIKPPNFDPSRRYPVYQFTYAGPHIQQVKNSWGGSQYMYHQLLAQKGVIVWICDNRTASGKGSESVWPLYRNLGESELRDIEDGVAWLKRQPYVDGARIGIHGWSYGGYMTSYALTHSKNFGATELRDIEDGVSWLKQQPYVDAARIGIHGWSYGGYMTSYALTHSKSFVMGIAGGTVADWRDYDTVYTERYMGLPAENPDGYRKSSPRFAAGDLSGSLLLIHGMIDDNVHMANTVQFVYELQKAQKPFQLMLYPKSRHGVTDPQLVKHLRSTMLSFVLEHLKPETPARGASASR
jgi:dipeptidyl-peptidase-4